MIEEQHTTEEVSTVDRITELIVDKKGSNIVVIDLRKITAVADFFIIATGNSNVHVQAIASEIREKLRKERHIHPWHVEGEESQRWILLDYVDIVVHVFDRQTREFYDIEGLYRDAGFRRVQSID